MVLRPAGPWHRDRAGALPGRQPSVHPERAAVTADRLVPAHHRVGRGPGVTPAARLARLRERTPQMVEMLEQLTSIESPSSDPAATERCAKTTAELFHVELGVASELVVSGG